MVYRGQLAAGACGALRVVGNPGGVCILLWRCDGKCVLFAPGFGPPVLVSRPAGSLRRLRPVAGSERAASRSVDQEALCG